MSRSFAKKIRDCRAAGKESSARRIEITQEIKSNLYAIECAKRDIARLKEEEKKLLPDGMVKDAFGNICEKSNLISLVDVQKDINKVLEPLFA